jgi:SHS2 domain-containing protein
MKYKFLEHTADIKFKAYGKNLAELYENCVYAMCSVMHSGKVVSKVKRKIEIKGKDLENLLYVFLEEFLFLIDSEGIFLSKIDRMKVDTKNFVVEADVFFGDSPVLETHVKAVTYNDMFVKKEKGKWVAQIVLDV